MRKSPKGGKMDTRKKQLVNLPEEQKAWITRVVEAGQAAALDTNQTEILRIIVSRAMQEDPEAFVSRLEKARLKARLDDIERRKAALAQEESEIAEQLSAGKGQQQMAHAR